MSNNTTLARTDARDLQRQMPAGTIHPALQAQIDERKLRNALVQQIRGAVWAKEFDQNTIRAVAEYAFRYGIDPVTEIEVLGGRIYKAASYYQRRGAELIAEGTVTRIDVDHVAHDPRLETLAQSDVADEAEWARREIARRMRLRIQHGAPEKAAAVCVTRIHVRGLSEPIEGCNWCGGGVRQRDPVGDAEPTKTAETRSARRAWKQLVSAVPALAEREAPIDEAGASVSTVLQDDRARQKLAAAENARALPAGRGGVGMVSQEGYGSDDAPAAVAAAAEYANADPYGLADANARNDGEPIDDAEDRHAHAYTPADDGHDDEPNFEDAPFPEELPLADERPVRRRRSPQEQGQ